MSDKLSKHAEAVWQALWPYIASEDPPDSGSSEKDLEELTSGVLPKVWSNVLALEADNAVLLAVVRPTYREALELWHELNGSDFDEQDFIEWLLGEDEAGGALAALPEHLRAGGEEA